jgi:molybdate transport system substrate-binding protein
VRSFWLALLLALARLACPAGPVYAEPEPARLTVFGAADLAFALEELGRLFERASGARVTLVLGSSGNLARQIEHGAPADVFFSANRAFVEDLRQKGALIPESVAMYARGRLALVVSRRAGAPVGALADLARPEVRRIAIASPAHAPYGQAAREALEALGLWHGLKPRLVYGQNVRHALQLVQTGATEAGLVALSLAGVPEVDRYPVDPALHRPLDQFVAVVRRSARPALGLALIHLVNGPAGRPVMRRHGFLLPGES